MRQRMPATIFRDGRVYRLRFAVVPELGVRTRVSRITIVRVHHMAARATRGTKVTRIVVGSHEPHQRIVQASLMDIEHRHGDTTTGSRTTIRLLEVGSTRLFEALNLAQRIRNASLRKQVGDVTTTALESTKDICRREIFPTRQRIDALDEFMPFALLGGRLGSFQNCGYAFLGIALA